LSDTETRRSETQRASAYDRAVALLAQRTHFRAQLATKLAKRGYPEDEVEAALDRLAGLGYLDDHRAAREYAEAKLARGPLGRRRLAADLARQGAPRAAADAVLDELLPEDDRAAAREAARAWLAKKRGVVKPQSLAGHLERRGFSPGSIWTVLDDLDADASDLGR
jgi:regulatory protein